MDKQEQKITSLYIDSKLSEQQIAAHLGVSPSKVRWVMQKYKIPKRSISDAIRYLYITKFNKKQFILNTTLTAEQEKLKLAGVMLYWGEGSKKGNTVAFANSDPIMVALFSRFLKEVCGINILRLHVTLHLYEDLDDIKLKKFWSKIIGLSQKQFYKSHVHHNTKGSYKKKSKYGTVSLQYSDTRLLRLILRWISEYSTLGVRQRSSVGRAAAL